MKDILIAIFSALIGAILQKRHRGKLLWLLKNERLITPDIGDPAIKIYYKTKVIKGLSIAKILVVNDGQRPLTQQDFVNGKGIVIAGKEHCRLLRIDVVEHTDTGNVYTTCISKDRRSAIIKFHHFNAGDAFLLQIFHTGKLGKDLECSCSATGISTTERISIIGHTYCDLIVTTILQSVFCMGIFGLSVSWISQGGIKLWLSPILLLLIILVVFVAIASWEFEYRFKGWYKIARKNGF